jgi:CRP-like cAMP-binding protein
MSKMIRLLRFLRSIKFFNQTEKLPLWLKKLLHQDSFIKGIFRTSIFTLLMVHIVACLWKFAAEFDTDNPESNWMLEDIYKDLNDLEIYIACIYWAIQTVFTVGYGDFEPLTVFQLIISILAMLFGVFLFGTIISSISNIFESMHNHSVETISLLDNLYKFRDTYKIDDNLYQKCIEYILNRKSDVEEDYKILFKSLPAEVRKAMNKEIYKKMLSNIEYFSDKPDEFLGEIGPRLENISFSPHDQILNKGDDAEEVYFLKEGVVEVVDQNLDNVLKEFSGGSVFGEWDIFFNNGIRKFFVTAKTECKLYFITKKDFDEIFFQKYTNQSNQLMLNSKKSYEEMVKKENQLINMKAFNEEDYDSDTESDDDKKEFNLNNIVKSEFLGKLAGTLKDTKEFKEVVYLQNINTQIDDLQSKIDKLYNKLSKKENPL